MRARMLRLATVTPGERGLLLAFATVSLFSCVIAFVILARVNPGALMTRWLTLYELWVILAGGLGGAAALYICRERIGRPGLFSALLTLVAVSLLAALIGGSLALPLYGTMFGPFLMLVTLAASPVLALLWCVNLCAVHVLLIDWQAERDSIFAEATPD